MAYPLLVSLSVGIFLRVYFAKSPLSDWLTEKNEIATPLTSWKRVTEGLALHRAGISPYSGDLFHEMPLMLGLLNYLHKILGPSTYLVFVAMDLVTAIVLERIAKHIGRYFLIKQQNSVKDYAVGVDKLILKGDELRANRLYVIVAYIFNPYVIGSCLAQSTSVFNNLALALTVLFTIKGNRLMAWTCLSLASYISLYPIMLIVPMAICFSQNACPDSGGLPSNDRNAERSVSVTSIIQTGLCTLAGLGLLLYLSFILQGSWQFLHSTYGFILTVPDLTPNIGVFWYFFTEMFEHFRLFFICVFQINAFIYTVPLSIKLRDHPLFLMYILISLTAIFKSYPSYADAGLYLAMLPLWRHTFPYMRNTFIVSCMLLVCMVLAPVLWHLWIYAGSANANFYFAITLVYCTAQIFLVTDLLFAFLRREYDLQKGIKPPVIGGLQAQVILD